MTSTAAPSADAVAGAAVPVYTARPRSPVLHAWGRLLALGIGLGCLAVLVVATRLTPSAAGVGSHQGLGLQPCAFLDRTGVPCPSCGMTTSFAWFARGNLLASLYVQPMGAALAIAAAMTVWAGLYIAITGKPVHRLMLFIPGRVLIVWILGMAILGWGWKILIHLNGIDGWR